MSKILGLLVCGLLLSTVMAAPVLAKDYEIPVVTGEHWTKSSPQERKAFLLGAATVIELDQEVQGASPAKNSSIDAWAHGLSVFTFDQMVAAIDRWYAEHPDHLNRPVVEVMWYELARPNCPEDRLPTDASESIKAKAKKARAKYGKP